MFTPVKKKKKIFFNRKFKEIDEKKNPNQKTYKSI